MAKLSDASQGISGTEEATRHSGGSTDLELDSPLWNLDFLLVCG